MEIEDNIELYVTQDILQLSILQQTYGKAVPWVNGKASLAGF